ncbi:MAG: hypothetical protein ISP71_06100 [Flavobacteriales bacterium]|nr:hypothetical protein [Flavobacteriales bacterium]
MRLILNIAFLLVNIALFAQTPGIPYQAILLSQDDPQELPGYDSEYSNVLRNSLVSIQFSIQDINGLEFKEYHSDVIVDDYGMINLIVGRGTYTYNDFYEMDWNGEEKWLKVEIDFDNGMDFDNLDYLPIHWIPGPDRQRLFLTGDSLIIENGGGVDLSSLLATAGNDNQSLTLVGNVIYLENGGSIDLTDLLENAGTDDQRLTLTGTLLNLEDGGTVDLSNLLGMAEDNQHLTNFEIVGSTLHISIEDGNTLSLDISPLAHDSTFVSELADDSLFINLLANDSTLIQAFSNNGQMYEVVFIANNGQTVFTPPMPTSQSANIDVYRNGARIGFTIINTNSIELEAEATCYQDDEIRIVQYYTP